MKKRSNYRGKERAVDKMNPEFIMSLKEDFQDYIDQRPQLKHLTFEEFLSIAKNCKELYGLISEGKIKIKKHPIPDAPPISTEEEEPQIVSLCRCSRKAPHIFCSLPTGMHGLSSPNRLRQLDQKGRKK
ncbi:MAG: hypothetical protein A2Y98_01030 [Candidatus Portnoybacteria bacterium RBG_19FT_COMBO_36_7]|uniref:Uncharacterized protein n=1 Tax=Candidatus Portnoybacteria bacterium RBG_19FT_COMBO_36_7 TaxID=1801992 RepID=A0A1G2F9K0_9BACT|nr:MAG: hypothetical protein A2Y98_01030 [Candidatus Portnoybacteria bacterium RBG_19FT_COMBO_36_7]